MTACSTCGREKSQNRCWLLSCPTNGGTGQALAMMRPPERDLFEEKKR